MLNMSTPNTYTLYVTVVVVVVPIVMLYPIDTKEVLLSEGKPKFSCAINTRGITVKSVLLKFWV